MHEPFFLAYLIGECIDQREKRALWLFVCRGSEREERENAKKCVVGTLYTLY